MSYYIYVDIFIYICMYLPIYIYIYIYICTHSGNLVLSSLTATQPKSDCDLILRID